MRGIIASALTALLLLTSTAADSTIKSPGSVSQDSDGALPWSNLTQAKLADGFYANAGEAGGGTFITNTLVLSNFGFAIPSDATITGVKLELLRAGAQTITDGSLILFDGLNASDDKADTVTVWPSSFTSRTYGSDGDVWGMTLTPTILNASSFAVRFDAIISSPHNLVLAEARLDAVTMTVYFTPGSGGGGSSVHHRKRAPIITQVGRPVCIGLFL